jgi:acid phosphatase (class A)
MPAPTICVLALAAALLAGCQTPPPASPEVVGGYRKDSGYRNGCLERKQLPNSLALLPPAGGGGFGAARLRPGHRQAHARAARHAKRTLAAQDVNLKFPAAAGTFECALQIPLSQEGTSNLNMLLRRTLLDAGLATYAAKDKYQRALPFVAEKTSTCTAAKDAALAKDGSYPSGHASLGWA